MAGLSGRTALVTGAARRIGRDIALALAAEGVHCLLHYNRSGADAEQTLDRCRRLGVRAEGLAADLVDLDAVERLAAEASERGVDILVHNASTFTRLPFLESPVAAHRAMLERDLGIHVTAPYLLGRILGERMVERGFGRIVVVGDWSTAGAVYRHYAPYLVSKAAVPTLVKVLAFELGSRCPAVTANAILPGPILPPETMDAADLEMVKRQTVLGQWIGAEEVARTVVFLAGSEKITGAAIPVDGGRAIKAL